MSSATHAVRVLIVDDSPAIRAALGAAVAAHPRLDVIAVATDGIEGVDAAREHRPDVVLMDVRMPRRDGISAARDIRAELPDTRIVMLSAYEDQSIADAATAAGVSGFLFKGVPAATIHETILGAAANH